MGGRFNPDRRISFASKPEFIPGAGSHHRPYLDAGQPPDCLLRGWTSIPPCGRLSRLRALAVRRGTLRVPSTPTVVCLLQLLAEKFREGPHVSGGFESHDRVRRICGGRRGGFALEPGWLESLRHDSVGNGLHL